MDSKTMVFYQYLNEKFKENNKNSGTVIRPEAMKKAFQRLDFKVITIDGTVKKRNEKVKKIKKEQFDFTYCESTNIPFALSEEKHFPIHPFADLHNLKILSKKARVGFFYRDIFWKEHNFFHEVGIIKGIILYLFFYIEFLQLINIVDFLFVPSESMKTSFPHYKKYLKKMISLPPGIEEPFFNCYKENPKFRILYSGCTNINSSYNITNLIKTVEYIDGIELIVNSDSISNGYNDVLKKDVDKRIVFSDKDFNDTKIANNTFDIGIIWQNGPLKDLKKYMPIKLFYYLRLGLPVIGRSDTEYGDFIVKNKIGWTYSNEKELISIINYLKNNKIIVSSFIDNVKIVRKDNTWFSRSEKVLSLLMSKK